MTGHISSMLLESHGVGILKTNGKVYNVRDWTILLNRHQNNGNFNNVTVNTFLGGFKKKREKKHKCTVFVKQINQGQAKKLTKKGKQKNHSVLTDARKKACFIHIHIVYKKLHQPATQYS